MIQYDIPLAMISVTLSGFVENACFDDLRTSAEWAIKQKEKGLTIHKVHQDYARRVLFTNVKVIFSDENVSLTNQQFH
jgi:hypothetical protein